MPPTPPSVDMPSSASGTEDRIRRNVACISCRNSKVRCKTSPIPGQPCQRCSKLVISCVVDKSHKRITKRSKLEQLEQELQSIKQVVNPKAKGETSWSPASPHPNTSSFVEQPRQVPRQVPTPLPDPPTHSSRASERNLKTTPTEARQLGAHIVPGADIDWYYNKYLQCYHPLLPILRKQDPDECYEASPTLFWVVILVASRRYSRSEQLFTSLTEYMEKDVWASISAPAQSLESIHALLLLCAWPLTTIRFVTDPSPVFANIALNACVMLGLHTGSGSNSQFCIGSRRELISTSEEASSTWLACCALAQRAASTCGHPPPSIQLNDNACKNALESPEWADLITMFNVQKFLNRLHTSMNAQISADGSVRLEITNTWEDDFETLKPLLVHRDTETSRFIILAARLEIQIYYFSAPRDAPNPNARLSSSKAFSTARTLINTAADLETRSHFLTHAPHWVLRTVMDATCAILAILHSTHAPEFAPDAATVLGQHACDTVLRCSVRLADLAHRGGVIFETFWSLRHLLPIIDGAPLSWPARTGAGLTFWSLHMFKDGLQEAKSSTDIANRGLDVIRARPARQEAATTAAVQRNQSPAVGNADPFSDVDWSMFMDDFGWVGGDSVFMGLPA